MRWKVKAYTEYRQLEQLDIIRYIHHQLAVLPRQQAQTIYARLAMMYVSYMTHMLHSAIGARASR